MNRTNSTIERIRSIWFDVQFFAMIGFMLVGAFQVVRWADQIGRETPQVNVAIGPETGLGQAMPFSDLSPGTYRVIAQADDYTTILAAVVPTGDIPLLVRDVPKHLLKKGTFRYGTFLDSV